MSLWIIAKSHELWTLRAIPDRKSSQDCMKAHRVWLEMLLPGMSDSMEPQARLRGMVSWRNRSQRLPPLSVP